jgi:GntR family transcriptional regulator, rspAB operon transcriptional repressor
VSGEARLRASDGALERTLSPPDGRSHRLVDEVVQRIRTEIVRGRLDPGRHLVETRLAEDLGVSRGTVREALAQLASGGLLEFAPGAGHRVRYFSQRDIVQIGEIFAVLEGRATMHADLPLPKGTERELRATAEMMRQLDIPDESERLMELDREFHERIMRGQPQTKLYDAWRSQESLLWLMAVPLLQRRHSSGEEQAQRHLSLIDAAMSGDHQNLVRALEDHYHQHDADLGSGA